MGGGGSVNLWGHYHSQQPKQTAHCLRLKKNSSKNLLYNSHNCFLLLRDLMDRLVDEAEGLAVDGSSSVCSGGAGGRMEVSAGQQLGLLNTITASDLTGECCPLRKHGARSQSLFVQLIV